MARDTHRLIWLPALICMLCFLSPGCNSGGESDSVGENSVGENSAGEQGGGIVQTHNSPEEAFSAAKACIEQDDFHGFARCLTPESQDMMAGAMVMGAMMMKAFGSALGGAPGDENAENKFAKIDDVLAKHGVSEEKLAEMEKAGPPADPMAAMRQMVAPITDKPAFFRDLLQAFESLGEEGEQAKGFAQAFDGSLEGLTTDGDQASAEIVWTEDGEEKRESVEFRKINGGWLLHLPM